MARVVDISFLKGIEYCFRVKMVNGLDEFSDDPRVLIGVLHVVRAHRKTTRHSIIS